jgi:hypothetical protein
MLMKRHPIAGSQTSAVQRFWSLQLAVVSVNTQPDAGLHVSLVQALLSLHTRGEPA